MMKRRRPDTNARLSVDAYMVHRVIRTDPGIASKRAIADATGLTANRVAVVIRHVNGGDSGFARVEYGVLGGRAGWYAIDRPEHHPLLDQADAHMQRVEDGIRRWSSLPGYEEEDH